MKSEAILRDADAGGEPRRHHPPANRALIYAAIVWTALRLEPRTGPDAPVRVRTGALVLAGLLLLQLYLGALVAGLHAGLIFNTWPGIDGGFIPPAHDLFVNAPWWRNFFENHLTVQFDHRMLAYTIWALAGLHAIDARRSKQGAFGAVSLWLAVTLQATLGVLTLLFVVPLPLALTHQAFAVVTFTIAVIHAAHMWPRAAERREGLGALTEKHT